MKCSQRERVKTICTTMIDKVCERCGAPYKSPIIANKAKYCEACRLHFGGNNGTSARALKWGARHEPIDKIKVFERDGWVCQICYEPVDRRAKWPHPRSASLDHIIPFAAGGDHTYDNVQCSHWECNGRKHSKNFTCQLRVDFSA